jgi:hypothetical protein
VSRWLAFLAVCDRLRAGFLTGSPSGQHSQGPWEELIASSSHHRVTPALAWCVAADADVPADVRDYLDAVLKLNGDRNRQLLGTLARTIHALNAIGIEPLPLKGAAHLMGELYPTPALRVLGDLDLLVPYDRAAEAATALQDIGFTANGETLPPGHHHLRMLCDPMTGAGVELHTSPANRRNEAILPASWMLERAHASTFRSLRIRLADGTAAVAHNIVHGQLDHECYRRRRIELCQLLDLALLRYRHEQAVDWAELDRRFAAAGAERVLATCLHLAQELLGQPAPRLRSAPRAGAVAQLRRTMEPGLRLWTNARTLPLDYLAARRRHPAGLLALLQPSTWRRGIGLLRAAAKARW